jgi:myo-inositol-1(or 4)-monophosphatase
MNATLLEAARAAGQILMEKFESGVAISYKGAVDLVTEADRAAEACIVDRIRSRYPDHDILAEEEDYGERNSNYRWIIDPLDGTTNYAHGFPWFAVSIGLEIDGEMALGVVYNPYVGELYRAERGQGAFLNERRLQVSRAEQLDQALLATGFPYDRKVTKANNYDHFVRFQQAARACRRPGVASLDLASVAAGRFDGFWEMKLKPWDVAAGVLLVIEAGGTVTDFDGEPMRLDGQECLASNGGLHAAMQEILQQGVRPQDDI